MNLPFSRRTLWLTLLALVVIWFGNLEYRKLIKPDEGRYAEIPREMVASGDWVTPHLNDFKYFEKPPLQYWATAVAYEVFGEHQWTSRLWTALTGFLGILLTGFVGMRLFGRAAGLYAALILGSSTLYVLMAHVNTLDMGVTFFITLGIFSLLLAQNEQAIPFRRNWMMLAWAGMALAVLSKGLMGLILPAAALFLYSVFNRDASIWLRMHWISGLLAFFAVAAPWFVLVMQANPEFFQFFFIHEH
ncbi:MAG: glycosyltransferase family 39 protein, partial [Sideroxydans sp.]|nr:glycosyltransferase family 39 protein [Sideroxydans sp.]